MARDDPQTDHLDVIIVGAGISGIDAAYRLKTRCKGKTWLMIDQSRFRGDEMPGLLERLRDEDDQETTDSTH